MNHTVTQSVFQQLEERQIALQSAIREVTPAPDLQQLLDDIDRAIARLGTPEFGKCIVCNGYMDEAEMQEFPARRYCLCELSRAQQAALQRDLDLAWEIQMSLLPAQDQRFAGWQAHYRYWPAGPISGDYCDVLKHQSEGGWLYFLIGDVSGKGVAAACLMAHLGAIVRRTLDEAIPVTSLMEIVNRHLNERSPETHFVTLVAGRAHRTGRVEICNAGHCPPIVIRANESMAVMSNGLPVGIDGQVRYQSTTVDLAPNETILLYTDGVSEATNGRDELFGSARIESLAFTHRDRPPGPMVAACLADLCDFRSGNPVSDDVTMMAIRREANLAGQA